MQLSQPVVITPRLLPGVRVGDAWVSIEYASRPGSEGRTRYRWYIDLDGHEFTGDDLQSGASGGSLQSGLESLLSFMSAFGESVSYQRRTGREGDNADLFPAGLADWADINSDELGLLASELGESADAILE